MRAKYSPTISERYVDRRWWFANGGGFGLLEDGRPMTDRYQPFDHEGFDQFGYNENGRDRAGYSMRDYESSEDLYATVCDSPDFRPLKGKSVSDYWLAVSGVVDVLGERFPNLPITLPQEHRAEGPGISVYLTQKRSYGVVLRMPDVDGMARTLDIRFDDGTGGSSPERREWSVNVVANTCGDIRRAALCMIDTFEGAVAFASAEIAEYAPDRLVHDVILAEGGDGVTFLKAVPHGRAPDGDILGSVYAGDARSAIEKLAGRFEVGGPISRMAARGIRRLVKAGASMSLSEDHDQTPETPVLPITRTMSM